jgi:putative MFS transporter
MGLVVVASIFDRYDLAILQMALPQIQSGLGITDAQLGGMVATIRLGALPAFLLMLASDWLGRRRLLIFTVLAYTLFTGATAFATTPQTFVILQFCARIFITAEVLLAAVIITEEFPQEARGWGIGALVALSGYGFALAALLFAFIDLVPFGWRALYLVALVPLLLVARLRRNLPETERFEELSEQHKQRSWRMALKPVLSLATAYPGRMMALGVVVLIVSFATQAAFFYDPAYLQEAHNWQPFQISLLFIGAGAIALFGSAFAGALGDRIGRKRATVLFLLTMPFVIAAFYNGFGLLLPLLWAAMIFAQVGAGVSLETVGNELFPTSYRATASGARSVLANIGAVLGLSAHTLLSIQLESRWTAIAFLAPLILIAPIIVALTFPETSGRSLEEIAPER